MHIYSAPTQLLCGLVGGKSNGLLCYLFVPIYVFFIPITIPEARQQVENFLFCFYFQRSLQPMKKQSAPKATVTNLLNNYYAIHRSDCKTNLAMQMWSKIFAKKYVNTKRITSIMSGESLCSRLHGLLYIDAVAHGTNSKSPMESFGLTCPQSHIMKAQPAKLEKLLLLGA